tara:strand:+ start:737 stop:925 length:189 start_codon:yes stop_codon:yes gene_type:complete
MAKMTKTQARKRIAEAVAKLAKVHEAYFSSLGSRDGWTRTPRLEMDLRECMNKLAKQVEKLK